MRRLTGVEAGRGIAALLVVSMHARDHLLQAGLPPLMGSLFAFGHTGVDFFFVLSGFIILHVHAPDIGTPGALPRYLQRRFTRVYPFYWVALAFSLLAATIHHPLPPMTNLVTSALILPLPVALSVPVAWSLQHEIVFYALFATLILNRNIGLIVLGGWLALILPDVLGITADNPTFAFGMLVNVHSVFDLEFFLGMLAALLLQRTRVPYPRLVLLLGVAGFAGLGALEDLRLIPSLASITHAGYGIAAMLIVLGAVEAERQGRLRAPRPLVALGGASYALYLTHLLTIGAIWQVLLALRLTQTIPGWLIFIMFLVISAAVGWVASRTVEAPVTALARRLLGGSGRRQGPVAPATGQPVERVIAGN